MLGIDVTRVLEVPNYVVADDKRRRHVVRTLAIQTTIAARYGVYSAHRVLYEGREDKREQILGTPDIDDADPVGDFIGGWVLVGEDVDSLRDPLEDLETHLPLQTDEEHFAPFALELDVVDGNRRSAYATALARQCRLKHLNTTRRTVSLLQAVTSDVVAAAKAVSRLGSEADQPRDLEPYDVRSALAFLDPEDLIPDIGPRTVSAVVQTLLDVDEPVTTSELANLVGVTTQALANNEAFFADLEAAGLLEREDLGVGKATLWRISLPFEAERRSSGTPTSSPGVGETGSSTDSDRPVDGLAECCFAASHRDIDYGSDWFLEAATPGGNLGSLLARHPELQPLLRVVLDLVGTDYRSIPLDGVVEPPADAAPDGAVQSGLVDPLVTLSLGKDSTPETTQTSLATAN